MKYITMMKWLVWFFIFKALFNSSALLYKSLGKNVNADLICIY